MSCCPCIGGKKESSDEDDEPNGHIVHKRSAESKAHPIQAQSFTFRELATATKHFTPDSLLGEGGISRVYKGVLENGGPAPSAAASDPETPHHQPVAIKQLDRNSMKDAKEFHVEVLTLSLLRHPNLVPLLGYCADGDQRLLVLEFMPNGSLHDHLHGDLCAQKPLDWQARMSIASGAAQGLEYLHHKAKPPIVYRDLKSSSILLDRHLTPKLSDFGQAMIGPMGDTMPVASRVMGTYGYSSPEYTRNGDLTLKSDVYSFGVVLLELITGRRALDPSKPMNEQNLVSWAQPMFKEQRRYPELVDPILQGDYPLKALNQAVAIAAMCIQEEASARPLMADVVITLRYLAEPMPPSPEASPLPTPDDPNQPPSSPSSSDSDDHVVETLQLGRSRTCQVPKARSRCISRASSSRSSSSTGSDEHRVVETLQLGRSKAGQVSKAGSRCCSRGGSSRSTSGCSDDGSRSRGSSGSSRSSSRGGSGRSSSSKTTGGSSKSGSRSSSSGHSSSSHRGSDGSGSRRSSHGYESD